MGLYLCVFDGDLDDIELEGVDVGGYDDFHAFRSTVHEALESDEWGSTFPTLMRHPDSDGTWMPTEAAGLTEELKEIALRFKQLPTAQLPDGWQRDVARQAGLRPQSLFDCFFDVDGEPLLDRLLELTAVAMSAGQPIWFQ
jgi:hypothetical protein